MRGLVPAFKTSPLLSEFFEDFDSLFDTRTLASEFRLACDVQETDNHILLTFDVPGLKEKDITIEYENSTLTVAGERLVETDKDDKTRFYRERRFGKFSRSFKLPETVDVDKIDADYTNGVLNIMLPKVEKTKPKKIDVSINKPGLFDRVLGVKGKSEE